MEVIKRGSDDDNDVIEQQGPRLAIFLACFLIYEQALPVIPKSNGITCNSLLLLVIFVILNYICKSCNCNCNYCKNQTKLQITFGIKLYGKLD